MTEGSLKVIIADDDPVARTLIESIVQAGEGLELVGSAEDAKGAVELAEQHQPDVAVLDWMMPGGGGSTAALQIGHKSPSTQIVALTASDSAEASLDMLRAGAKSFVVKGGPPDELVRTIHKAVTL